MSLHKMSDVRMKPTSQETRIALLEQANQHIYDTLVRMDNKLERIDDKVDRIRDRMDTTSKWYFALGISVFFSAATLALSLYKVF